MSIYIDNYTISVKGKDEPKAKTETEKVSLKSSEGIGSRAFIDLVEQMQDGHDCGCEISVAVTMKQHDYK